MNKRVKELEDANNQNIDKIEQNEKEIARLKEKANKSPSKENERKMKDTEEKLAQKEEECKLKEEENEKKQKELIEQLAQSKKDNESLSKQIAENNSQKEEENKVADIIYQEDINEYISNPIIDNTDEQWKRLKFNSEKGKELKPVNHNEINYEPFRKDLYIEPQEISNMSDAEVSMFSSKSFVVAYIEPPQKHFLSLYNVDFIIF